MRVLVIGKNSQLAQSIHKIINSQTFEFIGIKNFVFASRKELDLSNNSKIKEYFVKNKFEIIVNCAAYTAVDEAEKHFDHAHQINHLAVKKLAEISKLQKSKLIHISTDYVFDGLSNNPYCENSLTNPINNYGKTKLAGEQSLQKIMSKNALIIRTSWLYSEFGKNFVKTILELSKKNNKINVVKDQIGSPCYADDLSRVILKIINNADFRNKNLRTEVYHFSNEGKASWFDFAKEIFKLKKINCELNPIFSSSFKTPAKRPKNTLMNKNKITKAYDLKISGWKKSLKLFITNKG